jgi:signal transduction histidine kinase
MAAASMWLGWLIAGRVLRSLRTITTAARDISATNLHERLALEGPDDELKELADTFDGLLGRLDAAFQSQRRFVANASHELRTPLARLKTVAQVALADPDANIGSLRSAHERVLASEQQLEQLIDALLTLASGEQSRPRREPLDLATLTGDVLRARAPEIKPSRATTDCHARRRAHRGHAAARRAPRRDLIDNAIRHNTTRGRIDVTTATRTGQAVLSVANGRPGDPR